MEPGPDGAGDDIGVPRRCRVRRLVAASFDGVLIASAQ
jgi:hypothetical protein